MKHISAIIMAFVITAVIGLGIMVVGVNALTNTNTVPLQNSPNGSLAANDKNASSSSSAPQSAPASTDAQQLQQQVSDLQSQLDQANQAVLQYQTLLNALQQRGVIQIDSSGNVYIPQGESGSFH
jgi:peptidoglycan hydrolase CwlO-like protein